MASDPQIDGTRWVACTGCNGELGIPSNWSEPVAKCPNCGRDVAIDTVPQVLWRPKPSAGNSGREKIAVATQPQNSTMSVPPTRTTSEAPSTESEFRPRVDGDQRMSDAQWQAHLQRGENTARNGPEARAGTSATPAATSETGNPMAITGLCLGIASVLFGAMVGILPILAVIFSAIGLAKAPSRNGQGQAAGWAGLVLGIIFTLVYMANYGHIK